MLKILKMTENYSENQGSNSVYLKNYNLLYISPLKVLRGNVYVKVSLTLSQRNNSILKKVHNLFGHPVCSASCLMLSSELAITETDFSINTDSNALANIWMTSNICDNLSCDILNEICYYVTLLFIA